SGLPPTFIPVGSLDIFLDEDIEYARRLIDAGVPTDFRIYAGAPHGLDTQMPGTQLARRFRRDLEAWLLPHLHPEARTLDI
ncbi:MAG: alpha/beta hydrolase, partial [Tepidiformaceae bacterium]